MMKLKSLLSNDPILREFSVSERHNILEIADELRPLFENLHKELNSDKLITEGMFDRAMAKAKGAMAGGKALAKNISGTDDSSASDEARYKMFDARYQQFKRRIGTATAQYKSDVEKLGVADNPVFNKTFDYIQSTINAGPEKIDIKDTSASAKISGAAKAGRQKAAEKLIPIVEKAVKPISAKMEALYQKSGPIKNFDDKYKKLVSDFKQKHPDIASKMDEFSKIALQHKGKATFIVGAMVAILTAAGVSGPAAPVVAGIGMRGLYGMLAGEPPAKSFGKAAITALIGKLVGMGIKGFFNSIFDGISPPDAVSGISFEFDQTSEEWAKSLTAKIQVAVDHGIPKNNPSQLLSTLTSADKQILKYVYEGELFNRSSGMKMKGDLVRFMTGDVNGLEFSEMLSNKLEQKAGDLGSEQLSGVMNTMQTAIESDFANDPAAVAKSAADVARTMGRVP